jgi:hypothetical protein
MGDGRHPRWRSSPVASATPDHHSHPTEARSSSTPADRTRRSRTGSIDLWQVRRDEGGWSEPTLLARPSRDEPDEPKPGRDEFGPFLTSDGDLYFYSFRRPDRGGRHYRVRATAPGVVEHASELPDPSADTFVGYMTLSADARLAVFEGRQRIGRATDLFASRRQEDGTWSRAVALESINTTAGEGTPYLTPDGTKLFFASDRPTDAPNASTSNLFVVSTDAVPELRR